MDFYDGFVAQESRSGSLLRHSLAALVIAVVAAGGALLLRRAPVSSVAMQRLDNVLYDTLYRTRPVQSMRDSEIILIGIDDKSLDGVSEVWQYGWPWPRWFWARLLDYLNREQAQAVVFDLIFSRQSVWRKRDGDDAILGKSIRASTRPAIFAAVVGPDGQWPPFAPRPASAPATTQAPTTPLYQPLFGASNVSDSEAYRDYKPYVNGRPSMAVQTVRQISPSTTVADKPFRLHYYGPHQGRDGKRTFRYVSAGAVLSAIFSKEDPAKLGIEPGMFRGKIVLVGALAAALFDEKTTPLSDRYPGAEIHATAIANLLRGQQVHEVRPLWAAAVALLAALASAAGTIGLRRAWWKVLAVGLALAALLAVSVMLFGGQTIRWLPSSVPLVALLVAGLLGLGWSYFTEDKQRRFFMKVLSQSVSPAVAAEVARTGRLEVGGQRREMTVMFTDIAGFTDTSEAMTAEKLAAMLNFYLEEMSGIVLGQDGTIDKYIGDAVMSFWNAPLEQPDHAARACRAALAMVKREAEIQPQLRGYGAKQVMTRLGINTGPMAVGFMGSSKRSSYTVLGDAVNLGSRLEGTNKFYHTRICVAEPTVLLVKDQFLFRQLDVIRVKGKLKPMAIYELLGPANGDGRLVSLAQRYERALELYRAQQWDAASRELLELAGDFADDGPTQVLLGRIEKFRHSPPPADWDGVHVQTEK